MYKRPTISLFRGWLCFFPGVRFIFTRNEVIFLHGKSIKKINKFNQNFLLKLQGQIIYFWHLSNQLVFFCIKFANRNKNIAPNTSMVVSLTQWLYLVFIWTSLWIDYIMFILFIFLLWYRQSALNIKDLNVVGFVLVYYIP